MENRLTRIFKIMVAMLAILLLGVIGGFLTTVGAEELPEGTLIVETENKKTYVFSPDGYKAENEAFVSHTGPYLIYGEASRDISFTSGGGEPVTYDVIFHAWTAWAEEWYGIFGVETGVTLNITVYGSCTLKGFNHPGISVGERHTGASMPVVNFTIAENSSITIGSQYYETEKCVADGVEISINGEATSSLDLSSSDWRNNTTLVLSRGETTGHKMVYSYVDDATCRMTCDSCDWVAKDVNHQIENLAFEPTDENYGLKHAAKCVMCGHVYFVENHSIRYNTNEQQHIAYCNDCNYFENFTDHTLDSKGCTVCGITYIAEHTVDGEATKYLTIDALTEVVKEKGGLVTLLKDIEEHYYEFEADTTNLVIDLAGYKLSGVNMEVAVGGSIKVIDSSQAKTGTLIGRGYYDNNIEGELIIDGITLEDIVIRVQNGGRTTLSNAILNDKCILVMSDGLSIVITNVTSNGELEISINARENKGVKIVSGAFKKLKTVNPYGQNISVNTLLEAGYAFAGENGILDGSKDTISNVTAIVSHGEHTIDSYHNDVGTHWVGCSCGYAEENVEKEAHSMNESNICPVCKAEIEALVVGGEDVKYFTTVKGAVDYANTVAVAEVRLCRDATFDQLYIRSNITLELNNHKLTSTVDRIYVYGRLGIIDKSEGKQGGIYAKSEDGYIINVYDKAQLRIVNVEVSGIIHSPTAEEGILIEISGGKFTGANKFRLGDGTKLHISGGLFECKESVIDLGWGSRIELVITGGEFKNCTILGRYDEETSSFDFDGILSNVGNCKIFIITENGTRVTFDDITKYYEGTMLVAHEMYVLKKDEKCHYYECTECEIMLSSMLEHTPSYALSQEDASLHTAECAICKFDMGTSEHSGGTATCTEGAVCQHCNTVYSEPQGHKYDNTCDAECNNCGNTRQTSHNYDNACDTVCNKCGATRKVSHKYDKDGKCTVCGATGGKAPTSEIGTGAIVGIVLGSTAVGGGIIFAIIWFILRKKRLLK